MKRKILLVSLTLSGYVLFGQQPIPQGIDKTEWIKNNPDQYQRMGGYIPQDDVEKTDVKGTASDAGIAVPVFPQYVDTGDPDADKARYEIEVENWRAKMVAINEANGVYFQSGEDKEKWIRENPGQYYLK